MASITPSGTPGVYDSRNPTLVPSFDKPVMSAGGTLDHQSPATYMAANPRVDASVAATIGGTATSTNVVTLTVTCGVNALSFPYTVGGTDGLPDIANGLATLVNNGAQAQNTGLRATVIGTVVTIRWNGAIGNLAVATRTLSVGATETVTFANAGQLSGGSGPVFAVNNFTFSWAGTTTSYWYGQPYFIPTDALAAMVAQGMSIT